MKILLFRKKGKKTIPIKETTGKMIFQNEMGEKMGEIDFRAQADADKIRSAKTLRINSEVDGKQLESKEIDLSG